MGKKLTLGVMGTVFVILLIMGLVIFFIGNRPKLLSTDYFFSEELNSVVTLKIFEKGFLQTQAVIFSTSEATVGEVVSFQDIVELDSPNCPIQAFDLTIFRHPDTVVFFQPFQLISPPLECFQNAIVFESSFTPDSAGTYFAETVYYTLDNNVFVNPSTTLLTVTEAPPPPPPGCDLEPFWTDWNFETDIQNGIIESRIYQTVNDDCSGHNVNSIEYRTVCDSGFVIPGTDDNMGAGELSCELEQTQESPFGNGGTTTGGVPTEPDPHFPEPINPRSIGFIIMISIIAFFVFVLIILVIVRVMRR